MTCSNTVPWNVAYGLVAVSIIICNLLFLVVFFKSDRLRRMRSNLLLIGLTAADLIVGAVAIPMYMAILWPGSEVANSKAFRLSYNIVEIVSSFASLFVLAVIALERVYSVFWPYKHRTLSKTPYFAALFASWFLAALQLIFYLLQWNGVITSFDYFLCICITAVVIVIIMSYFAMWMKIKTTRVNGFHQRRVEMERNLAKTLTILTGIFMITWLPSHYLLVVLFYTRKVPSHLNFFAKFLQYSNSLANPVIYSFRFPEVRRTLAGMLRRRQQITVPLSIQMIAKRGEAEVRIKPSGTIFPNTDLPPGK